MRLIDAYGEHGLVAADNTDCGLIFANETIGVYDNRGEIIAEFDPDDIPEVDAVPVSVIKRAIDGCSAAIQCDQAGRYTYKLRDALKIVLEWYGSPNYLEHEKRCNGWN